MTRFGDSFSTTALSTLEIPISPVRTPLTTFSSKIISAAVNPGKISTPKDGEKKPSYQPSMELRGKYTVFAEGCRGHLGKQLIKKYNLDENKDPQHYGIGFKEIWDISPEDHKEGTVMHTMGWPSNGTISGSYFYHGENNQVYLGYVVPLDYENPLRVEINNDTQEPSPYVLVRKNLEALIGRNVFYQLVEEAELNSKTQELEIISGDEVFSLGKII